MKKDLLIEIGTEELPPKALPRLSNAFLQGVQRGLKETGLGFKDIRAFATPRRLALLVSALDTRTADKDVERRGPALAAAFDEEGCATKAAQGFARSCGVGVEALEKLETDKGSWLIFRSHQPGQDSAEQIPDIIRNALDGLPIPKRMRWGSGDAQFVRPVHWVVMLQGNEVIDCNILGVRSGRATRGHRFHYPKHIDIPQAADYEVLLESNGKVIADFARRRQTVSAQVEKAALALKAQAVIDADLLDEVTAMVEWPVAVAGNFEARFLAVPPEALISTMAANQKYFHLVDKTGKLMPHFITVSNIESRDPDQVRRGNERVIRPRFADAEFFWNQDRSQPLASRLEALRSVVFQKKLGSLHDKTQRVALLAVDICRQLGGNAEQARRAAELCKCDLMTEMVGEFPGLQGIMGRYYAQHDREDGAVALALDDYYRPRFAGDQLPEGLISQSLALADRLDTLVGIFAIGQIPSGDKDPYALRRTALGVLRILIEKHIDLDLAALLKSAAKGFGKSVKASAAVTPVLDYILDRLKAYYQEQGIRADVLEAVIGQQPSRPIDIDKRIHAVNVFRNLEQADSLAAANKRIGNILKKIDGKLPQSVNEKLLTESAEKTLYTALAGIKSKVEPLFRDADYEAALTQLATLRAAVDDFFDQVMVMAEDRAQRDNRVALLNQLHTLFIQVADISRLQS